MTEGVRGLETKHEHAAQRMARDTRPLGTRIAELLTNPSASLVIYGSCIAGVWIYPVFTDLIFLFAVCIFAFAVTREQTLPFRLPKSAKCKDYNDLIPGTVKPNRANGITFFGNDRHTREELWFTNSDMRTHVLIFGSTGSGKTEALVSLAFNSLIQGSGFIYVDGKGDNSLFAKIFSMVRSMGREDDLLTINFMTGARDVVGAQENRLSNTVNPFASGSSSMLSQLVVSLMDQSSGDANADMWKGRAINFVESLMKILTIMRDRGHILLDANVIRDYFMLNRLESIVVDKQFPIVDSNHKIPLDDLPPQFIEPLKNYVMNLPGYNPGKKGNQAGEVLEQHGFITMQLTRVFGSLADTYGHILRTNLAEVDLRDVVLNRRILVVLLPALEKSPEELANLGKIIIASLKAMMASGLGDAVEGEYRDVISRKPTNSPSPYVCIMDEYGYYAVKGFAVVAAQARSLGFSAIFAGQDLPAFQKASKEEAASIGANCNVKICMKLEDPQETWEYFNKTAGETYVTNVSGFQLHPGSMTVNYMDSRNASVDRRQRIELLDLKDQREGEAHIFFKSKIVRAEMFYANPQPIDRMRLNHFLKVDCVAEPVLIALNARLSKFRRVFDSAKSHVPNMPLNEDISLLSQAFMESYGLKPFERGIAGIIALLEHEVETQKRFANIHYTPLDQETFNVYAPLEVTPIIEKMIGKENVGAFSKPLLRRDILLKDLHNIERLCGSNEVDAQANTNKLVYDIEQNTKFPGPDDTFRPNKIDYLNDINTFIRALGGQPVTQYSNNLESGMTDLPNLGGLPGFEDLTTPNNLPDLPDLPDLPKLPDLPDFGNLPNLPDLPDLPNLEDFGKNFKMPDFNDLPDFSNIDDLDHLESLLRDENDDSNNNLEQPNDESTTDTDNE